MSELRSASFLLLFSSLSKTASKLFAACLTRKTSLDFGCMSKTSNKPRRLFWSKIFFQARFFGYTLNYFRLEILYNQDATTDGRVGGEIAGVLNLKLFDTKSVGLPVYCFTSIDPHHVTGKNHESQYKQLHFRRPAVKCLRFDIFSPQGDMLFAS